MSQTNLFEVQIKDMNFEQYNEMIRQMKREHNVHPMNAGLLILADMVKNGYNPLKPLPVKDLTK